MTILPLLSILEITETTFKTSDEEYLISDTKVDCGRLGIFDGEEYVLLFVY